jgi:hypothetical protein
MPIEDVERSVLGAVLLDGRFYNQVAELRIDDFFLDSHRRILTRMGDLVLNGRPVDMLTLVEELERHKELESVGGVEYVSAPGRWRSGASLDPTLRQDDARGCGPKARREARGERPAVGGGPQRAHGGTRGDRQRFNGSGFCP